MQYRHTRLSTRIGWVASSIDQPGHDSLRRSNSPEEEIDTHMKAWSEAGWRLHTVTSVSRDSTQGQELTHSFFWSKES